MSDRPTIHNLTRSTSQEQDLRASFYTLYANNPIPHNEQLQNLGLFINRIDLGRMLFLHEMYQKIINLHGVVIEFGVRWGQNMALLTALRGIYEPFNHNRRIIGFDTFSGFPSTHSKDGGSHIVKEGGLNVTENYKNYLEQILRYQEAESPIPHIKKFELVEGDAIVQVERYFAERPETLVAMAYFDFDLYEPTKKCLEFIKPHLVKGAVIGFDELNHREFPGESLAFKEVLGANSYRLQRTPYCGVKSYLVME